MSKSNLELLRAVSLLSENNSVSDLEQIPDAELVEIIRYYRDQRERSAMGEVDRITALELRDSAFLSSISASNAIKALAPKLLVHESLILDDPLFAFAEPRQQQAEVESEAMGFPRSEQIDRQRLRRELSYFAELASLIDGGYVHMVPVSILHKRPEVVPVNAPQNLYRECVPSGAVDFVFESVVVNPLEKTSSGIVIRDEPNLGRHRQISISFKNDSISHGTFYNFRTVKFLGENADGSFKISYKPWNDDPLDEAQYKIWEEQAINQTIGARLESVAKEMRLADVLGTSYLTESAFEANLLAKSGGRKAEDADALAVNFLEANSDILNLSDPEVIFRIRQHNPQIFERFRLSLKEIGQQLKGVEDVDFSDKAKRLFERDVRPQIEEINAAIWKVVESSAKGLLQTGVGLYLALLTGSSIPIAGLLGLAATGIFGEAIPAAGDYIRNRRKPEFIWSKLKS